MENFLSFRKVLEITSAIFVVGLLRLAAAESGASTLRGSSRYLAINCRTHTASLTDFGGVSDGKTLNTKAFQSAIAHLSAYALRGGAQLIVPPGKWLTGSFNLTSNFTLFLQKGAVILASQNETDWPVMAPLPSYGRGRDTTGGRYSSLLFGTNLTDVVITGEGATIDGQGQIWWNKFKKGELKLTRPYLIEIMYSDQIQISNVILVNSPSWNVHPIYCSNVTIQGITILAPLTAPNTDGINPDSCTQVKIQDCYIESGDDCVALKSGWDEYGIRVGLPTEHVIIRNLSCVSPTSAVIAVGSEMSGGIRDVRAEDIRAINSESGVRLKSASGRGGFMKDIYVKGMKLVTMKYVFWMSGAYKEHADKGFNPKAVPVVENINYRDVEAENVSMAGWLEGIRGDEFTDICISNVTIHLAKKPKKLQWNCSDIRGVSSSVTPTPCALLPDYPMKAGCNYPTDKLKIDMHPLKTCSY